MQGMYVRTYTYVHTYYNMYVHMHAHRYTYMQVDQAKLKSVNLSARNLKL